MTCCREQLTLSVDASITTTMTTTHHAPLYLKNEHWERRGRTVKNKERARTFSCSLLAEYIYILYQLSVLGHECMIVVVNGIDVRDTI